MSISSSQIISFTNPPTATGGGSVATNTAYGTSALAANTTGAQGVAIGYQALYSSTISYENTAIGYQALYSYNRTADIYGRNTAVGSQSAYSLTTGNENTSVGRASLRSTTTGGQNVAIGEETLYSNTTAYYNTAVGYQAGYSSTQDSACTYVGYQAGYNANYGTASGQTNTYIGYRSGYLMTTGYYNTILGAYSGNQGSLDIRTANNYIVLSDGQGNPRGWWDNSGNFNTVANIKANTYFYDRQNSAYASPSSVTLTMPAVGEGTLYLISSSNHSGTTNASQTMWMLTYSGSGASVVTQIGTGGNYTPTIAVSGASVTITNNSGGSRVVYASFVRLL